MIGAIATLIGAVLLYARTELFNPDALAERAGSALSEEDVRLAVAPTVVSAIAQVSPEGAPDTQEVADALASPRVTAAFGSAAGAAAERLFGRGPNDLDLDLANVTAAAVAVDQGRSLDELGLSAADFQSARLDLIGGQAVLDALDAAERLERLGLVLTPLGLLALLVSVALAPDRLRGLSTAALALALAAAAVVAALYVGREIVVAQFDDELTRDAVASAWSALLGDLRTGAIVVAGASGLVALAAGIAAGRSRPSF